jgi:N-methylhydantoinase A
MPRPDLRQVSGVAASGELPRTARRSVYFGAGEARMEVPVYRRRELPAGFEVRGPAIIEEYSATTALGPNDRMRVGDLGELRITCMPGSKSE